MGIQVAGRGHIEASVGQLNVLQGEISAGVVDVQIAVALDHEAEGTGIGRQRKGLRANIAEGVDRNLVGDDAPFGNDDVSLDIQGDVAGAAGVNRVHLESDAVDRGGIGGDDNVVIVGIGERADVRDHQGLGNGFDGNRAVEGLNAGQGHQERPCRLAAFILKDKAGVGDVDRSRPGERNGGRRDRLGRHVLDGDIAPALHRDRAGGNDAAGAGRGIVIGRGKAAGLYHRPRRRLQPHVIAGDRGIHERNIAGIGTAAQMNLAAGTQRLDPAAQRGTLVILVVIIAGIFGDLVMDNHAS